MQYKYDYTLKVGREGSSRLELLNELCNPYSIDFINDSTELKNKRVLEIGCGIGIMSKEIAIGCLPEGSILATDISNDQLELAKENANQSNLKNIDFLQISAFDIDQINEKFDIIYLRFLLAHLPNTIEIIQKILLLMHAESILVCEEPEDVKLIFSDPPDSAFEWWKKAFDIQIQACKGNFTIGKDLFSFFAQNTLKVTNSKTIQPVMTSSKLKQQLWQGVIEVAPILIASGFATIEHIEKMILELKKLAETSSTVGLFSINQIAAKKIELITPHEDDLFSITSIKS